MASTITADNGASSGSAGLTQSADSTGVLALRTTTTGGTATTAVTISTSQVVDFANTPTVNGTPIGGGLGGIQVFTSSGTFTIPSGISKIKVTVVGGGGNGDGTSYWGGGGGGGTAIKYLTGLTATRTLTITVGGQGGTSSVASGTQTISTVSATGGSNAMSSTNNNGGPGGDGSGGDINIKGGGGNAYPSNAGGIGGSSTHGGGGPGQRVNTTTQALISGGLYGGGGGGGTQTGGTGLGAQGVVIVEW